MAPGARLRDEGMWTNATAPQRVRAVTHLDVSREQVQQAAKILQETGVHFALCRKDEIEDGLLSEISVQGERVV